MADVSNWEGQMLDTDLKNAAIALKTTGAGGIDTLGQVCTQLQRERDVSCDTNICMKMFKNVQTYQAQRASRLCCEEGCLSATGMHVSLARWTSGSEIQFHHMYARIHINIHKYIYCNSS